MTIASMVLGILLLNEDLSLIAGVAFTTTVIGMYLVEPKASGEELVIKRSFNE